MPRTPALTTVIKSFEQTLESAEQLYLAVKPFADGTWDAINGWEPLYPGQATRVVALAFLQAVTGWEDLVEAVFVRYLAGSSSPNGYRPSLRLAPAKSLSHAFQLASGEPTYDSSRHYIVWNRWRAVEDRAKVFFEAGRPFTNVTDHEKQRLAASIVIRNRIAHNSAKCKRDFVGLAKEHLGLSADDHLPQGFSVGKLLLTSSSRLFGPGAQTRPYIEHYLEVLRKASQRLCPR